MRKRKDNVKGTIALLKSALNLLYSTPLLVFPFLIIAAVQLFVLEILFFAHRWPLSKFFAPLIRFDNELFLHYPYNFLFLTKWFQRMQYPIYIFVSVYFIAMAVAIIELINNDRRIRIDLVMRRVAASYVHLFIAGLFSVGTMLCLMSGYNILVQRASVIHSTSGIYYIIKRLVLDGAPFMSLVFSVIVTVLFVFVIPVIIYEKKKVFRALVVNFKYLFHSFWTVLGIVSLTTLLYLPILLLKLNGSFLEKYLNPDVWVGYLVVGTFVALFIDAIIYTSVAILYLLHKEQK